MGTGDAFAGFNEARISFPPTFKYDVLRSLKRTRTKSLRHPPTTPIVITPHDKMLSEVAETEREQDQTVADEDHGSQPDKNAFEELDQEQEQDAVSVASTAWTSVRSRRTVDQDPDDDDDEDADKEPPSARSFGQSPPASASAAKLAHKLWSAAAAHKAKEKWVSIFREENLKSPNRISKLTHNVSTASKKKWRQSWNSSKSAKSPPPRRASQPAAVELATPQTEVDPADPRQPKAGRAKEFQAALLDAVHARPHKHLALSENNVDLEEEDKGVYNSSHKQRVPSW